MTPEDYERRIATLEKDRDVLAEKFEKFEKAQIEAERRRLIAGIKAIGGVLLVVLGVIWNYRGSIFGGGL